MEESTLTDGRAVICTMQVPTDRTSNPRLNTEAIENGRMTNVPSDHIFIAEYANGEWRKERVQPYRAIPLAPFTLGLHYAQSVFEGMKAYRHADGNVAVFRTDAHHHRLNRSLQRMMMPEISEDLFFSAIQTLLDVDRDWVPPGPEAAYYIRPLVFASEERMGLKPSDEFLFLIMGGPFRPLYNKGLRVKVERTFSRAAPGGTGYAKCAGNYAGAMYPTQLAKQEGFDQVIWTDASTHSRVEESGTMNVGFIQSKSKNAIINDVSDAVLVTPELTDTILDGITRNSVLLLARELGISVEERPVLVSELQQGLKNGTITEAFGMGTAASLAPITGIHIDEEEFLLTYSEASLMFKLKSVLNNIRYGNVQDPYGWMHVVEEVAV